MQCLDSRPTKFVIEPLISYIIVSYLSRKYECFCTWRGVKNNERAYVSGFLLDGFSEFPYTDKKHERGFTMKQGFNHFDENGNAIMVDVSGKAVTYRTAVAAGCIRVGKEIMDAVTAGTVKKGDVLGVARVAGIMAVKHTSDLVPMCHPLPIQKCSIDYELDEEKGLIRAFCTVKTEGKTGVEMEALTGVQVTLLTIYDMCKAIDKHMVMTDIHLVEKTGVKSGDFISVEEDFHFCK